MRRSDRRAADARALGAAPNGTRAAPRCPLAAPRSLLRPCATMPSSATLRPCG